VSAPIELDMLEAQAIATNKRLVMDAGYLIIVIDHVV
jgi:hypothetical protein